MASSRFMALLMAGVVCFLVRPSQAVLSSDEKAEILRAHNFFRSKAKPTPTDMVALVRDIRGGKTTKLFPINFSLHIPLASIQELALCLPLIYHAFFFFFFMHLCFQEWDDKLAALSQFWAVSCTMEANENRHEQSQDYDYVGEITYGTANYTVNMTSMVYQWFAEGVNYDYSQQACLNENGEAENDNDECIHYLQVRGWG